VSLFKSASIVSLLTLVSRISGLVRELLIASTFGASALTDAFNVAFRIPNLFRRLFGEGAFSQAFVPVLAATRAQSGDAHTAQLIDRVATVLAWCLLALSVAGVLGAAGLVWVMASGLQQSARGFEAAVQMTRWMFPYIAFMSLVALAAGVLNTYKRFAVPAATPVLLNLSMIAAAWWGAPWLGTRNIEPIYALSAGVMVGGVLQLLIQWMALSRLGLRPAVGWRWSAIRQSWQDPGTQSILRLMGPALLGVGVAHLSMLINTQIASHLTAGSVSWISYADRLMEFPTALLGVALGVVLMPQLAAANASGDAERYSAMLDWGLRLVLVLSAPCAVALIWFASPLVAVLYHYGAMTAVDVRQVSVALMGWGAGLVGLVALKVLAPGYYAKQDTKTPVRVALAVLVLTQVMNVALVPFLAHAGLTLSIGLGALVNAGWLLYGLLERQSFRPQPGWWRLLAQVLLACAVLGIYLRWAALAVDWTGLRDQALYRAALLGAVLIGACLLYLGSLALSGVSLRQLMKR
jgi:putative peptidoglycan lipid II flippase